MNHLHYTASTTDTAHATYRSIRKPALLGEWFHTTIQNVCAFTAPGVNRPAVRYREATHWELEHAAVVEAAAATAAVAAAVVLTAAIVAAAMVAAVVVTAAVRKKKLGTTNT